jgi:hypothetical protein
VSQNDCLIGTIGVNLPGGLDAHLGQGLDKAPAVHMVEEDRLAPVAPIHVVVDRARIFDSQLAGHESTMSCAALHVDIKNRPL